MDNALWITMISIAIGTYLMRMVPFVWMSRRLNRHLDGPVLENKSIWLSVLGPTMIAAMFGTSLVPASPSLLAWCATVLGTLATILVWRWKPSLGLPVFVGVLTFGIATYLSQLF
jgi:branched-subunit amino acid transport protein